MIVKTNYFTSIIAQEDNLGDYILRRTLIDWLTYDSSRVHVLATTSSPQWRSAFPDRENITYYESTMAWLRAMHRSAGSDPTTFVFSPGPQDTGYSLRNLIKGAAFVSLIWGLSRRNGQAWKVGRSISAGSRLILNVERVLRRRSAQYVVRDAESLRNLGGPPGDVRPDIAFSSEMIDQLHASSRTGTRNRVAVSIREGESLDENRLVELVETYRSMGLDPVVVTQVRRDEAYGSRLATRLGCDLLGWPREATLEDQLRNVCAAYTRAAVVITNRLHAAIFAGMNGAVPIGFESSALGKLQKTLDPVGLGRYVISNPHFPHPSELLSDETRRHVAECVIRAKTDLRELRQSLVGPGASTPGRH